MMRYTEKDISLLIFLPRCINKSKPKLKGILQNAWSVFSGTVKIKENIRGDSRKMTIKSQKDFALNPGINR